MGKIKQGILGGFNGTTGSVVGASWKGIAYMRGKAQSIKNPRTTLQQTNRTIFGRVSDTISKALTAVNLGYRGVAVKMSPFNVAVQDNVKIWLDNLPTPSPTLTQFSKGSLTPVIATSVTKNGDVLSAAFSVVESASETRSFCGVALFAGDFVNAPYISVATTTIAGGESSGTANLPIPQGLVYESAYCFVFEYRDADKSASLTTYVGTYTPE